MGRWTKEEIEQAFERYQAVALEAGVSGDWNAWADQFTVDATYNEHLFGVMGGREAIRTWISRTMAKNPDMKYFPVEWHIIDEDRGWVSFQVWNRMVDPGDGSLHQAYNFTLLKYAGNGQWSYEEDVYNPTHFQKMLEGWQATKEACERKS
jgi:hypothetical protein